MNRTMHSALAFLLGALPVAAHAGMVQVRDAVGGETASGEPGGFYVNGTGASIRGTFDGTSSSTLFTGAFDFEADFGAGFVPLVSYCLEPGTPIEFGVNPPDETGLSYQLDSLESIGVQGSEKEFLEILWANALPLSLTGQAEAAAFQALVWEITEDDTIDLNADNLDLTLSHGLTSTAFAIANNWIGNIVNEEWTQRTPLFALTHATSQNLLTEVPAPGVIGLAIAGAPFALRRRRA